MAYGYILMGFQAFLGKNDKNKLQAYNEYFVG